MPLKEHGRQYDLIVFGASGYTGKLTAEHIVNRLPTNLKWALSGRSKSKLQGVIDELKSETPDRVPPSIEIADTGDLEGLKEMVKKTFILITTVGPYCLYGENVFKACAENGTHYIDITGETPWTARMIKKYSDKAKESGSMMFPQTGIESAPPDMCTWLLAKHIRETMGSEMGETTICVKMNSAPSGGTLASAFGIFDHITINEFRAISKPFSLSPTPHTAQPLRPGQTLLQKIFGVRHVGGLGLTTTSIAAITDTPVIERTWGLLSALPTRQKEFYGPNFHWQEVWRARNWLEGIILHLGIVMGGMMLALFPWLRAMAKRSFYQPGEGRTKEESANEQVEYRGVARPDKHGETRVAFVKANFHGGGMYYLTGLFLGQAALTLLEDDLGLEGGIYTPACLGQGFIDRCNDAGFRFQVETIEK